MKRIVVKVGSNVLTRNDGKLDVTRMSAIVDQLVWLRRHDYEIILVSSGAVSAGRDELHPDHELDSVEQRQLFSAMGQVKLMTLYYDLFREYNIKVGQVLTTKDNFENEDSYQNQERCISTMLDNDELSGLIAEMMQAETLVLLTNVDGIYNGDPKDPNTRIIPSVYYDRDISEYASDEKSSNGRGGMASKAKTAHEIANKGIRVIIANGNTPNILINLKEQPMNTMHTEFVARK